MHCNFQRARNRAIFRRFVSHLRSACETAAAQLGHREREAVYQRAVGAELSSRYTCELEYPVPVRFTTSEGRLVTLAHERADIVASPLPGPPQPGSDSPQVIVVEVKRGFAGNRPLLKDGMEQARRYASHISRTSSVGGVCAVIFDKTGKAPNIASEHWPP